MSAPAFQFYAKDFLSATQSWTIEEVGIYIRLLCAQWDTEGLPNDEFRLSRIAGCDIETFKKAWVFLGFKFLTCSDGLLRNARLEEVRVKQHEFSEKQRLNGSKGGRPPKDDTKNNPNKTQNKPKQNPTLNPNHNPNKSSSSSIYIYKEFGFFTDEFRVIWIDFLAMRKQLKAPATERAQKSILSKIEKLSGGDNRIAFEILDQSIRSSWKDVYAIKEETKVRQFKKYNRVIDNGRPAN